MNGVSHYLVGLLIFLTIIHLLKDEEGEFKLTPQITILTILIAFLSHAFVDAIAQFTYHPSSSNWGDPIYAGWHLATYVAEAGFAIYFLRTDIRYTIPMLSSVGFDLWDWSIRRPLEKYVGLEGLPDIHFIADATRSFLFGWAPSYTNDQWALIVEVIFVTFAFVGWQKWHNKSNLEQYPRRSSWKEIGVLVVVFGSLRLLTLV